MKANEKAVYIIAPPGRGKTQHAEQLAELLGCTSIIDEWDGTTPVPDGALVFTNTAPL